VKRASPVALAAAAVAAASLPAAACRGDPDIEKPKPLFTESPVEYPLELWDRGIEGSTVVRVLVNEEGGVDSVTVVESSGHRALDSAAARGALAMEFEPATKGGEPVRVWARVPVHFSKDAQPARANRPQVPAPGTSARPSGSSPSAAPGLCG